MDVIEIYEVSEVPEVSEVSEVPKGSVVELILLILLILVIFTLLMLLAFTGIDVSKLLSSGISKVFGVYAETRSKYRWRHRPNTHASLRPVGDWIFNLNDDEASADSPRNMAESVKILSATLKKEDMCIDVSNSVQKRLEEALIETNQTGKVSLYLAELAPACDHVPGGKWSLEILYRGHADPTRRIPADEFGVKYIAEVFSPILFPPYSATEKIRKGLTANKVLHARTFHEKNLTPLAQKYAGLKANFYDDVADSHVQKGHIDHKEVHVILSQKGRPPTTIVATRKEFSSFSSSTLTQTRSGPQ